VQQISAGCQEVELHCDYLLGMFSYEISQY
jgi:hypothetical protein